MIEQLPARRGIGLGVAHISHIGGRQSNQDAFGSARHGDLACFVMADGAGGHEGGEIASGIVVKAVIDGFTCKASFDAAALQSHVDCAVEEVTKGRAGNVHLREMSATVAIVLIDLQNGQALWAHMGDTRIYLFRHRELRQVTKDHSLVRQFIDAGYCRPDEARTHPQRNILFAAIGVDNEIPPEISQDVIELQHDDAILICTDGLWEWVTEDLMEQTLADAADAEEWLNRMHAVAEKNSAIAGKPRDNCTAQALWLSKHEPSAQA